MYLMRKDGMSIHNLENAETLFITNTSVCIKYSGGSSSQLGSYDTVEDCRIALKIVSDAMKLGRRELVRMPSDDQVRADRLQSESDVYHHATGKKTKGHGGS